MRLPEPLALQHGCQLAATANESAGRTQVPLAGPSGGRRNEANAIPHPHPPARLSAMAAHPAPFGAQRGAAHAYTLSCWVCSKGAAPLSLSASVPRPERVRHIGPHGSTRLETARQFASDGEHRRRCFRQGLGWAAPWRLHACRPPAAAVLPHRAQGCSRRRCGHCRGCCRCNDEPQPSVVGAAAARRRQLSGLLAAPLRGIAAARCRAGVDACAG
jgi:hypothetical protein